MKNILKQTPKEEQHGRSKFILDYVENDDVVGKKMLNIGCGFGWFEFHMVDRGCAYICGTEITEEDLQTAKNGFQHDRVTFKLGNALELPFPDGAFDTVVSWDVIEHIPPHTEKQMLAEIGRVLNRGGVFYLSTPYRCASSMFLDPAWWLAKHRHYSKAGMQNLVNEIEGLEIIEMVAKGGIWTMLNSLNMYVAKWCFHRGNFFIDFFNKKSDEEFENDEEGKSILFVKGRKLII